MLEKLSFKEMLILIGIIVIGLIIFTIFVKVDNTPSPIVKTKIIRVIDTTNIVTSDMIETIADSITQSIIGNDTSYIMSKDTTILCKYPDSIKSPPDTLDLSLQAFYPSGKINIGYRLSRVLLKDSVYVNDSIIQFNNRFRTDHFAYGCIAGITAETLLGLLLLYFLNGGL